MKGVPSCQRMCGRSFQVVAIRPSGKTCHSPFSTVGTASASSGCATPCASSAASGALSKRATFRKPCTRADAEPNRSFSMAGLPTIAAVIRFGACGDMVWPERPAGAEDGAQPRASMTSAMARPSRLSGHRQSARGIVPPRFAAIVAPFARTADLVSLGLNAGSGGEEIVHGDRLVDAAEAEE